MFGNYRSSHKLWFVLLFVILIFSASQPKLYAQDSPIKLTQTNDYDIGFTCPVAAALDHDGTSIWILMDNCGGNRFLLQAFNLSDGTAIEGEDYAEVLQAIDGNIHSVDPFTNALAMTASGDLSIFYSDRNTSEIYRILIPISSGGEVQIENNASYNALLATYSAYPEYSVYSLDHQLVATLTETTATILDVTSETMLIEIPIANLITVSFSANNAHLYAFLTNSDDPEDYTATLQIYDLADGVLLNEFQLPSFAAWISPDERYAAINLYSNNIGDLNALVIMNLETGLLSDSLDLDEAPHSVTNCLNTNNNVSDVGFMTDGRFSFPNPLWLDDNATIYMALSYGGDAASSGSNTCIFNYSRLRVFSVEAPE